MWQTATILTTIAQKNAQPFAWLGWNFTFELVFQSLFLLRITATHSLCGAGRHRNTTWLLWGGNLSITLLWCHGYVRRQGGRKQVCLVSHRYIEDGDVDHLPNHSIEWAYSHYSCMSTMHPAPPSLWCKFHCLRYEQLFKSFFFFWFMFCDFSTLSVIRFHRKGNIPATLRQTNGRSIEHGKLSLYSWSGVRLTRNHLKINIRMVGDTLHPDQRLGSTPNL